MNTRREIVLAVLKSRGFPERPSPRVHRSQTPYLSAFNGPASLLHAVEVLRQRGVSLRRARILPDIGRALEPETRLASVEPYLDGLLLQKEWSPVQIAINVREDNRLHRFLPLAAIGLPPRTAVQAWEQGRAAAHVPPQEEEEIRPLSPLEGYHQFYLEPGAMPADWTNRITPAERLAIQLCQRFRELCDPAEPPQKLADRMLIVFGRDFEERDNPLAGLVVNRDSSLISQIGSVLELVEVFLTHAMLTIAGGDILGGFEWVLPWEPPFGRPLPLVLSEGASAELVAMWFNAYPHRRPASIDERWDPRLAGEPLPRPYLWSEDDPGVQRVTQRIEEWYNRGAVQERTWQPDTTILKYKLAGESLSPDDMLSLARAYMPDFLPNYPKQIFVTGGMNVEGLLLGLVRHWLQQGTFLGMDYADWELFSLEQQVVLCSLLVQRKHQVDQCAMFEAAARLLLDEGIKTWIEQFHTEKIRLHHRDRPSPLAQLGHCLPLGGSAALHAPQMMVRIPRDYTRDPEAQVIEQKLMILEDLFLPANIRTRHIWEIDWVKLGETSYLKRIVDPVNPDLIPVGVRLYDGY